MRLIFIYGPPAVGKLTVARELGRLTGLAVFDNHLSFDCVRAVFPIGSPTLNPLVEQVRRLVIGEAARQGTSLIFTFVYAHPHDDAYVGRICDLIEGHGGSVDFVLLTCEAAVQEERVVAEHRIGRKVDSVAGLRAFSSGHDFSSPISGRRSLELNTTSVPAEETALRIAEEFGLAVV